MIPIEPFKRGKRGKGIRGLQLRTEEIMVSILALK
jgi:hypothetical protein